MATDIEKVEDDMEVVETAEDMVSEEEFEKGIAKLVKQREYHQEYHSRPEVKEAQKNRNKYNGEVSKVTTSFMNDEITKDEARVQIAQLKVEYGIKNGS